MSEIRTVTVVGGGTMGRGIAHVAAAAGMSVRLHDVSEEAIQSEFEPTQSPPTWP